MTHNCLQCGKQLRRRPNEYPGVFRSRRFCSVGCASQHKWQVTHICPICNTEYCRKPGKSGSDWLKQIYCSQTCAGKALSLAGEDALCECGAIPTDTVYFRQFMSSGQESLTSLNVCADCLDLFLATDKTARLEPWTNAEIEAADHDRDRWGWDDKYQKTERGYHAPARLITHSTRR